jgi:hypothetical protein
MKSKLLAVSMLGTGMLALAALPAVAHHGWGGQARDHIELTGTVEQAVSLAGPHAAMKIKVDGQVWDITLAPSPRTAAAGLKADTLPLGAQVTIQGHRSMDPKRFEVKTERVTYNGKLYNVYPDRD